jgi:hypothetical protein
VRAGGTLLLKEEVQRSATAAGWKKPANADQSDKDRMKSELLIRLRTFFKGRTVEAA